jgi:hypothetical protein
MKKTLIIVVTVLLVFGLFLSLAISCSPNGETREKAKEVKVETSSNYVFKKIYVKDKRGFTHEILTASSGNTLGGVSMLELCVYKE